MKQPPPRLRVVFDCNSLVQALAFDNSPAAACLRAAETGQIELFVSNVTLKELRRVCGYERVRAISPAMTPLRIDSFVQRLLFHSTRIRRVTRRFEYPRDPADEPYINLAIAAEAHFLVSRDNDLLSLASGFSLPCKQLRRLAPGLKILTPEQFLASLA